MTTPTLQLSDLAGPDANGFSDVAVFVRADGSESEPFVVTRHGREFVTFSYVDSRSVEHGEKTVRRLGRGRLVPARIEMEGEADLAAQVKMLREALQLESARLSSSIHCGEMHEQFGPSCSHYQCHAVHRIRKALAATAPTPPESRRHRLLPHTLRPQPRREVPAESSKDGARMTDTEPFAAPPTDDLLAIARPVAGFLDRAGHTAFADVVRRLISRVEGLEAAIVSHRSQKADDRCIEDDDVLYAALGDGIKCDRRVGDKADMLVNCARFIENRCEGGHWPTYTELERRVELSQLAWTDAKPTVPGWYWWRDSHWTEPIRVIELDGRLGVPGVEVGDLDPLPEGQFAGPIPHPADAREGDGKR